MDFQLFYMENVCAETYSTLVSDIFSENGKYVNLSLFSKKCDIGEDYASGQDTNILI